MSVQTREGTTNRDLASGIGAGLRRRESLRFVRGKGSYLDDLRLPGTLHACFVRSSMASAVIEGVDTTAALAVPGVVGVYTAEDLAAITSPATSVEIGVRATDPLARKEVRYVGEAIAVVVASDRYVAEDAAEVVRVSYQQRPAVVDPLLALAEGAPKVWAERDSNLLGASHFETENWEAAFARAHRVVKATFSSSRITSSPIEPRGVMADWDDDRVRVWTSTAGVHDVRRALARTMDMPESKVWVHAPDVGGSFGSKNRTYPEELAIPAVARLVGRPVKWVETRPEHLMTARQGRGQTHEIEAAVAADGRILALRDSFVEDEGAALAPDNAVAAAWRYLTGAYDIQEVCIDARSAATNKVPHGALRGIGKADAAWVIERLVDRVARELHLEPNDVRRRNLVPAEAFPYRTATGAVLDSGRYHEALDRVLDLIGYDGLRAEAAELRASGVHRGIGTALIIEPTSATRRDYGGGYAACRLRMDPTGVVSAYPNIGQQGQGHQTVIAQIVAEALALLVTDVEVFEADTSAVPFGPITGSSRSSVILMPAVLDAAERMRAKLCAIGAARLGVDPAAVELVPGAVRVAAEPGTAITLGEVLQVAHQNVDLLPPGMDPGMELLGFSKNPNIVWEPDERGRLNEFALYPYDVGVAVVDVDVKTGRVDLVKYASVHDCGTLINPLIVRTQHLGCIVHGIGAALYEEIRYSPEGDPESSTFMDYLLPTVNEVPELLIDHLVTPSPFTTIGAKGAGETGMLTVPPAVGNAIEDALGHLGAQVDVLPYTAVRVLEALRRTGTTAVGS